MAIPTRDQVEVESTLVGEVIPLEMSQDAEDQPHLASIYIDMYEDPITAAFREYYTNALDAHIEAGVKEPIHVTLPNALGPVLEIEDFGTGLGLEDMRDLYSKYGKSLKRTSNDFNGMLGIGCKSALSYTTQFTVTSVRDGRKLMASIARQELGGAEMTILKDEPTDERNGTKITIPIGQGDHADFKEACEHITRFAPEGAVLIDGQPPKRIQDAETTEVIVDGELYLLTESQSESDWLVMGNVPYPVNLDLYEKNAYGDARVVVAFVENGGVHFTPAREALQQTERTKARVEKARADYLKACAKRIEGDVQSAPTKAAAFTQYWQSVNRLQLKEPPKCKYKGEAIPEVIAYDDVPDGAVSKVYSSRRWHSTYRRNSDDVELYQFRILPLEKITYGRMNDNTVRNALVPTDFDHPIAFVTNFFPTIFSADQRRRLDAYRAAAGKSDHRMILLKRGLVPMKDWMEDGEVWDWNDIRKWRDPSAPKPANGQTKRVAGSYTVRQKDAAWGVEVPADRLPDKNLYWMEGTKYDGRPELQWLLEHNPKAKLVVLPTNRVEKFKRNFPYAVEVSEAREAVGMAAWDQFTEHEKALFFWSGSTLARTRLAEIAPNKIDDPELSAMLQDTKARHSLSTKFAALSRIDQDNLVPPKTLLKHDESVIIKRYPLLTALSSYTEVRPPAAAHLILYFNAAYADKKENA